MQAIMLAFGIIFSVTQVHAQTSETKLNISHLSGNFYIYTTYNNYQGNKTPAHGMYLVTNKGVALFDTPWDTTQFQPLLDSIQQRHHQKVALCIATHWHSDRTAGLEYYRQQGIKTYSTILTDEWSKKKNEKRAEYLFTGDTTFNLGPYQFETFYPGPGHTADNIVIWFGKEKILYGGCLIKGAEAKNLGNLGDANVLAYETTLQKVQKKFPKHQFVIVSHHHWNNNSSLQHSIKLAKELKKEHQK